MKRIQVKTPSYKEGALKELGNRNCLVAGLWNYGDYGTVMGAYALYKFMEEQGKKPVFLDVDPKAGVFQRHVAESFIYGHCQVCSGEISQEELDRAPLLVTGSGSVWDYRSLSQEAWRTFFGIPFDKQMEKIAFSASFGKGSWEAFSQTAILEMKTALKTFRKVSVRTEYDAGTCEDLFDVVPEIVCNPVLLCDSQVYLHAMQGGDSCGKEPYIFSYVKNKNERIHRYLEEGIQAREMPCREFAYLENVKPQEGEQAVSVASWLRGLYESDYVVTDCYICACLALALQKPFSLITGADEQTDAQARELLVPLELEERMVPCYQDVDIRDYRYLFRKPVKYHRVNAKLNQMKDAALQWYAE